MTAPPAAHALTLPLSAAPVDSVLEVVQLDLEPGLRAWLAAVGVDVGERLVVLRRAILGGPLHLRRVEGGELALDAGLSRAVRVTPVSGDAAGAR